MRYLLHQVQVKSASAPVEARSFDTIPDVLKHLNKINLNQRLVIGEKQASVEVLQALTQEKLSTVSIALEGDAEKRWIITAF